MIFDDVLTNRRSIRHFLPKSVSERDVCLVIKAAILSPSPKNRQPWKFSVLTEEEKNKAAAEMRLESKDKCDSGSVEATAAILESAPVAIAVKATENGYSDTLSLGAAMYAMCLKATDLGLGSLWIGDSDVLKGRSEYADWAGVILLGYPDPHYPLSNMPRNKFADVVENLVESEVTLVEEDHISDPELSKAEFVFVSYSHAQSDCVKADAIELKKLGIPLWYDKGIICGERWNDKALSIVKHDNCKVFLWYITDESIQSNAVYKEVRAALRKMKKRKINIIPIVIGENVTSLTHYYDILLKKKMFFKYFRYKKYFGTAEKVVYLKRNTYPAIKWHLEDILAKCFALNIVKDDSVYDVIRHVIKDNNAIITSYQTRAEKVEIPNAIMGCPVTEIAENVFRNNQCIKSVTLPKTIRKLGSGAFLGTNLTKINLPESVEEIETACFRDCTMLEEIKLPSRITYLSEALFRGCKSLKQIDASNTNVAEMKEAVFCGCSSLEIAILPKSLTKMTDGGFACCENLTTLSIPSATTGVDEKSFNDSPRLERVEIGGYIFEKGVCIKKP